MNNYSGNNELKNIFGCLDHLFVFDDKETPEIKLRDNNAKGEIDAIALYKNAVLLIGINNGNSQSTENECNKFFKNLETVIDYSKFEPNLDIKVKKGKDIKDKEKQANDKLNSILSYLETRKEDYDIILRKIFFMPRRKENQDKILEKIEEEEYILDKEIYEYLLQIQKTLDDSFLVRELLTFLDIKKIDFTKKASSRTEDFNQISPLKTTRLEIEENSIIMYTMPVRVDHIMELVSIPRLSRKYDQKGFQRFVKESRLRDIVVNYLDTNQTFPNNIIIGLHPDIYLAEEDFYTINNQNEQIIKFYDEYNSLILIDGQHRYLSFIKGRKLNREIIASFLFFQGGNKDDKWNKMQNIFHIINSKSKGLDATLQLHLYAKNDPLSDESFWLSIFMRLDKEDGFFKDRFSFKETVLAKQQGDQRKGIVSIIKYGGLKTLRHGKKQGKYKLKGLKEFFNVSQDKEEKLTYTLIKNYFYIIRIIISEQANRDKNQIEIIKRNLSTREIGALFRILHHFLIKNTHKNLLRILAENEDLKNAIRNDSEIRSKYDQIHSILKNIPMQEAIKKDYGTSNWGAMEGFMLKKIHEKRPKFGDKKYLTKKGKEVYGIS
ncbi:MAG: DGQHR domain-containing protein [Candidatus Heimdallarchaeaceae archaeon]